MLCQRLKLNDEIYLKYQEDALRSYNPELVSAEHIGILADEAKLLPEHKENLVSYMNSIDDDLKKFLWLFYYVQFETAEDFSKNIWQLDGWSLPEAEEKYPGMMKACVYLLALDHIKHWVEERRLSYDIVKGYIGRYHAMVEYNLISHNTNGMCRLSPFLLAYAKPFAIVVGRLAFQILEYKDYCEVYENSAGNRIFAALPNYQYDDEGHICDEGTTPEYRMVNNSLVCHTFNCKGTLDKNSITIDLNEYKKILSPGDIVATIHIPGGGKLSSELVNESIREAWVIINKHIRNIKAMVCRTWFIDPGLSDVIKPGSNLHAFAELFDVFCTEDNENHSIFEHIFMTNRTELTNLKPKNDFQQKILDRALQGKKIYWGYGLLKKENEFLLESDK